MQTIRLNKVTGVPVFRQIVEQISFMVEMGQLDDGDRLPSSRMLAANLHVNRNTVARAYSELRKRGLVSRQGRHGMVVRNAAEARATLATRENAHEILGAAVNRCIELGLAAEDIASLAYQQGLHAKRTELHVIFVECNIERTEAFATDLEEALEVPIAPKLLDGLGADDIGQSDLIITTFYHLAEVRRLARDLSGPDAPTEVLAIVVAPHLKTLVRLTQIPRGHRTGIYYTTEHQAQGIRQSLADAGIENVDVIASADDPAIDGCDVVIVPSESPELAEQIRHKASVLEYGNVLDGGSVRMASEVVDEVRERKANPRERLPVLT